MNPIITVPGVESEPMRDRSGYALLGSTNGWDEDAGEIASRYGFRRDELCGFFTDELGDHPEIVLLLRSGHAVRIAFATWEEMGDCGQAFSDYVESIDRLLSAET